MEPVRSKSFQEKLVEMSQASETKHQIIITTSMISEELNDTDICVGEFYTKENKTLKLE